MFENCLHQLLQCVYMSESSVAELLEHEQSHSLNKKWQVKYTNCAECVSANTRLHWGDREMATAIQNKLGGVAVYLSWSDGVVVEIRDM